MTNNKELEKYYEQKERIINEVTNENSELFQFMEILDNYQWIVMCRRLKYKKLLYRYGVGYGIEIFNRDNKKVIVKDIMLDIEKQENEAIDKIRNMNIIKELDIKVNVSKEELINELMNEKIRNAFEKCTEIILHEENPKTDNIYKCGIYDILSILSKGNKDITMYEFIDNEE